MPLSDVLLVNVKMLTLSELEFLSGKARRWMLQPRACAYGQQSMAAPACSQII